nr:MAG TPA: hypothetical protein [Caudoviricetes sp.]
MQEQAGKGNKNLYPLFILPCYVFARVRAIRREVLCIRNKDAFYWPLFFVRCTPEECF